MPTAPLAAPGTSGPALYLNLGCGRHSLPNWRNLDFVSTGAGVEAHDLRRGIPQTDGSCAVVYHSHVLEHFDRAAGRRFLQECARVLCPGGILRIVVPDLEQIARHYLQRLDEAAAQPSTAALANHEYATLELLDQLVRTRPGGEILAYWRRPDLANEDYIRARAGWEFAQFRRDQAAGSAEATGRPAWGARLRHWLARQTWLEGFLEQRFRGRGEIHRWMYDRVSLAAQLRALGLMDVTIQQATTSFIPDWTVHQTLDWDGQGPRKPDSLFLEARKPA